MEALEGKVIELAYALDTFYFLVMGAFVMWMAAGFTMLESGLVRAKKYSGNSYKKYIFIFDIGHHVYGRRI
jgi:Amt family ammonium transporter